MSLSKDALAEARASRRNGAGFENIFPSFPKIAADVATDATAARIQIVNASLKLFAARRRGNARYSSRRFFRVSIRDSNAAMLSDNYHTAFCATLIGICVSVRRGFADLRFIDHASDSANASRGRRDLIPRWTIWNLPAPHQFSLLSMNHAARLSTD